MNSQERKAFIEDMQRQYLNGAVQRHNEGDSFVRELNSVIDEAISDIRNKSNKLLNRPEYNGDERLKTRVKFKKELFKELKNFKDNINAVTNTRAVKFFKRGYKRNRDSVSNSISGGSMFSQISEEAIMNAVNYPFMGQMWSDRVWNNLDEITKQLERNLAVGIASGDSVQNIARKIDKSLVKTGTRVKHATERIVRTEYGRVLYQSDVEVYEEFELEQVEFSAHLDDRTSQVCKDHHEKIYDLGEEPPLPLHPYCRSCYLPYLEPKSADQWVDKIKKAKAQGNKRIAEQEKMRKEDEEFTKKSKNIANKEMNNDLLKWSKRLHNGETEDKRILSAYNKVLKNNSYSRHNMSSIEKAYQDEKDKIAYAKEIGGFYQGQGNENTRNYEIMDFSGRNKKKLKLPYGIVYEPINDGDFYFGIGNSSSQDYNHLLEMAKRYVKSDDRLSGLKICVDDEAFDLDGTLAFYNPNYDILQMRSYSSFPDDEDYEDTFTHELGHRKHNQTLSKNIFGFKKNTVSDKDWKEYEKTSDEYYVKYFKRQGKRVIKDLPRMSYPINAEKYYSDKSKSHFYQEIFAEAHSIIKSGDSIDKSNLKKYFPNLMPIFEKYK